MPVCFVQNLKNSIDTKQTSVEETVELAHSFLLQQDLRQKMPSAALTDDEQLELESIRSSR